jgi:hypothetical protein
MTPTETQEFLINLAHRMNITIPEQEIWDRGHEQGLSDTEIQAEIDRAEGIIK